MRDDTEKLLRAKHLPQFRSEKSKQLTSLAEEPIARGTHLLPSKIVGQKPFADTRKPLCYQYSQVYYLNSRYVVLLVDQV